MKKIKYFGVVLLFAIIGVFLGYFIPFIHDNTNLYIPDFGLLIWLPIIILLIIAIVFFQKGKTKIHQGIDNDKNFEDANKFLCLSLGFITLSTPLSRRNHYVYTCSVPLNVSYFRNDNHFTEENNFSLKDFIS